MYLYKNNMNVNQATPFYLNALQHYNVTIKQQTNKSTKITQLLKKVEQTKHNFSKS